MAMTDLLQFTINVRKSHCRPQCTLQRMLKIMCHLSELIFTLLCAAAASKMRVSSVSCVATFPFGKLGSSSYPTNKKSHEQYMPDSNISGL